MAKGRDFVCC